MKFYNTMRAIALAGLLTALPYVCDGGCSTYGNTSTKDKEVIVRVEKAAPDSLEAKTE